MKRLTVRYAIFVSLIVDLVKNNFNAVSSYVWYHAFTAIALVNAHELTSKLTRKVKLAFAQMKGNDQTCCALQQKLKTQMEANPEICEKLKKLEQGALSRTIAHKQKVDLETSRLTSDELLTESVLQEIIELKPFHEEMLTEDGICWSLVHEKSFHRFKNSHSTLKTTSMQLKGFVLTAEFKRVYLEKYEHENDESIRTQQCSEKMKQCSSASNIHSLYKIERPLCRRRKSNKEQIATYLWKQAEAAFVQVILNNLESLVKACAVSRRRFLHGVSTLNKDVRIKLQSIHTSKKDLERRQVTFKKDVQRVEKSLKRKGISSNTVQSSKEGIVRNHAFGKRNDERWTKMVVDGGINCLRALKGSTDYAESIKEKGGGKKSSYDERKIEEAYAIHFQRGMRGFIARRYVWALRVLNYIWYKEFHRERSSKFSSTNGSQKPSRSLSVEDFEELYEKLCYKSGFEEVYVASFACAVSLPTSGLFVVPYDRFMPFWHKNMFRASNITEMIHLIRFVRQRESRKLRGECSSKSSLLITRKNERIQRLKDQETWKAMSKKDRTQILQSITRQFETQMSALEKEYAALEIKAKKHLLPLSLGSKAGKWNLVREIVNFKVPNSIHHPAANCEKDRGFPKEEPYNTVSKARPNQKLSEKSSEHRDSDKNGSKFQLSKARSVSRRSSCFNDSKKTCNSKEKKILEKSQINKMKTLNDLVYEVERVKAVIRKLNLSEVNMLTKLDLRSWEEPEMKDAGIIRKFSWQKLLGRQDQLNKLLEISWSPIYTSKVLAAQDEISRLSATKKYIKEFMGTIRSLQRLKANAKDTGQTSSKFFEGLFSMHLQTLNRHLAKITRCLEAHGNRTKNEAK